MPFKDKLKQLIYMRDYQRVKREKLNRLEREEMLHRSLLERAIKIARQTLTGRKRPVTVNLEETGTFIAAEFKINSNEFDEAIHKVVERENRILTNAKGYCIVKDLDVSFLDVNHGLVWEIIKPIPF